MMVQKYFTQKEREKKNCSIPQYGCWQVATPAKLEVKPRELELMLKRKGQTTRKPGSRSPCPADACDAGAD